MSSYKKIDLNSDFAVGVYLSSLYPPNFVTHCISICTYLKKRRGRGRGESSTKEKVENTNIARCISNQSVNSDKHLPQGPFSGQFVQMTTFCFGVCIVNQSMYSYHRELPGRHRQAASSFPHFSPYCQLFTAPNQTCAAVIIQTITLSLYIHEL